ncbi:transposase [Nitrosomonas sp. Nm166]|uniref:transposase n=1 Tax=Nitrosomonas sp. Nm166 TaxID=1881054 RepID=UPI000AC7D5F4|nr:transposase [Nitrosomonas sp. Nm166]
MCHHASGVQEQTTLGTAKAGKQIDQQKRYIVEQCFGTAKCLFRMERASYFGTVKVNAQVLMKSICMNLKKAANKIFAYEPSRGAVLPNAVRGIIPLKRVKFLPFCQ